MLFPAPELLLQSIKEASANQNFTNDEKTTATNSKYNLFSSEKKSKSRTFFWNKTCLFFHTYAYVICSHFEVLFLFFSFTSIVTDRDIQPTHLCAYTHACTHTHTDLSLELWGWCSSQPVQVTCWRTASFQRGVGYSIFFSDSESLADSTAMGQMQSWPR